MMMSQAEEPRAIRVRDLVVGFGPQVVIDHLSLDVRKGEILGLVGASGGGKSVLTHDLASLNTVCDRVAALADGKIVAIGPMHELLQSEHPWVRAYFHGKRSQMLQPQAG
jgi:ABC-type transporter Mla maintaining outer membrane lipid asymmetry ATPase subunit MlaF